MFKATFYTNATWFTDTSVIGRARTIEDGLMYLAENLKYHSPNGYLFGLDGTPWCYFEAAD